MSEEEIPEWAKESLPESLHSIPFLKGSESAEDFTTKLSSAAQHMGNSIRIPGPDAGDETWQEFENRLKEKVPSLLKVDLDSEEGRNALMNRMGRPEKAEDYGAEGDSAWLAEVAHKAGLTKAQFSSLVTGVTEANKSRGEQRQAVDQEALDNLFEEWGLAKPKKMEHIVGLAKLTKAPEEFITQLEEGKADAGTLRWLDKIAGQFAEVAKFRDDRTRPETLTPEEATAQISELMANPDYFAPTPIGQQLRNKMLELQKAANPGASQTMDDLRANAEILDMFGEGG